MPTIGSIWAAYGDGERRVAVFPLSSERLLILTNRSWACNPHQQPIQFRANPDLFRGAMFNFLEIQTRRCLSEREVLMDNCIIKRCAYRFIAAEREEWLYPERNIKFTWRVVGDEHLLMPDPRSLHPGAEITIGYVGGNTEAMDTYGRRPGVPATTASGMRHAARERINR